MYNGFASVLTCRKKSDGLGTSLNRRLRRCRLWIALMAAAAGLGSPSASRATEPLTITITNCATGDVEFINNTGTTDIDVKLVTAAFRGFKNPSDPGGCPDLSYWEVRYPSVKAQGATPVEEGALTITASAGMEDQFDLDKFLPDNFDGGASRPAADCLEYMVSLSAKYVQPSGQPFLDPNGQEYPDAVASCTDPSPGFSRPTVPSTQREDLIRTRTLLGSLVVPAAESVQSPEALGQCGGGDSSAGIIQNRSLDTAIQGIWAGKFACKKGDDDSVLGANGVCREDNEPSGSTKNGRGIRGMVKGFRLEPDDCGGTRVNPGPGGFPECCDCDTMDCASPVVVQCVRGVVIGEILPGDSTFTFFEPFIFLDPVLDLEPRTEQDVAAITPNRLDLSIDCSGFALSDIEGFIEAGAEFPDDDEEINYPFNDNPLATNRFDFDFDSVDNDETNQCTDRCASSLVGNLEDLDVNGIHDACQHIGDTFYDAGKGRVVEVRRRVRNVAYDGSTNPGTGFSAVPNFDTFQNVQFAGSTLLVDPNDIDQSPTRYDEVYGFETPGGVAIPLKGQQLLFDTNKPVTPNTYDAFDMVFAGTTEPTASTMQGLELIDRTRLDLVAEERKLGPAWPTPIRDAGQSAGGAVLYVAASDELFVYESRCLTKKDGGSLNPTGVNDCASYELGQVLGVNGLGLNVEPRAVAVEPDDDYVYVASGDPDTIPGDGWLSVLHRSDHSLFADPGTGLTLLSEIRGTPVDMAVVNLDDGGTLRANICETLPPSVISVEGDGGIIDGLVG